MVTRGSPSSILCWIILPPYSATSKYSVGSSWSSTRTGATLGVAVVTLVVAVVTLAVAVEVVMEDLGETEWERTFLIAVGKGPDPE